MAPNSRCRRRLALLLALLGAPRASASVWIVDASGGGHATSLQAAVDAAADGDVLLVRGGTYAGFTIQDEELVVAAEAGAQVVIQGRVRVRDLAATRAVVLAGLSVTGRDPLLPPSTSPALHVDFCAGAVRVFDTRVEGGGIACVGGPGALVIHAANVVLVGCSIRGGVSDSAGGKGLIAVASQLALERCEIRGARGSDCDSVGPCDGYGYGGDGAPGLELNNGSIVIYDSLLLGGDGGAGTCLPPPSRGGNGAYGFDTGSATNHAWLLGTQVRAGLPGAGPPPGSSLPDFAPTAPSVVERWSARARRLAAPRLAREGASITIELAGMPGDTVELLYASRTGYQIAPASMNVDAMPPGGADARSPPVVVGADGRVVLTRVVPELGPGIDARLLHFQARFTTSAGDVRLAPPAALLMLDRAL